MITVKDKTLGDVSIISVLRHGNEAMTVRFKSEAGELIAVLFDPGQIVVFDPEYPMLQYRHRDFERAIRLGVDLHESANAADKYEELMYEGGAR